MKVHLIVGIIACVVVGIYGGWHRVPNFGLGWLIGIGIFFAVRYYAQRMRRRKNREP